MSIVWTPGMGKSQGDVYRQNIRKLETRVDELEKALTYYAHMFVSDHRGAVARHALTRTEETA